jgi:predicted negative regulator of RcsB-dependent stress response
MVEIYDSHEQSERVKGWLRENGSAIVIGLALAFGGLFGFKQWQLWDQGKARRASAEYELMVELLASEQLDSAVANYETLKTEFPKSSYTAMAAMQMAAARIEAGQSDLAVGLLELAMANAEPAPLRVIARERLARLKLDQGDADGALQLLDSAPDDTGFEARFAEIRGDILLAQDQPGPAAAAYQQALDLQESGVGFRRLLEMKLEALGGSPTAGSGS